MNSRLKALIKRGYNKEEVIRLATYTEDELEYASRCAFRHISRNCNSVINPLAIFIGGQPGCGKTVMSMNLKNKIENAVEIGIDNYRMYHPRYLEIEECIRNHWKNRVETINDTPGNDIADFTHLFAGAMTDKLIEMGKNNSFNLLLEWGMREPLGPLNCMKELRSKKYNNIVLFVGTHKDVSYDACLLRAKIMKDSKRIIRKVPKNFHDYCVETLPESINTIYEEGFDKELIDYMAIINRENKIIWDNKNKELPGDIYIKCLNQANYDKNNYSIAKKNNEREMEGINNQIVYLEPSILDISKKM